MMASGPQGRAEAPGEKEGEPDAEETLLAGESQSVAGSFQAEVTEVPGVGRGPCSPPSPRTQQCEGVLGREGPFQTSVFPHRAAAKAGATS